MKIVKARITEMPKSMFDKMPDVFITLENGEEKKIFSFYPDEINFVPSEFVGLTEEQAKQLRHKKDVAYLKS